MTPEPPTAEEDRAQYQRENSQEGQSRVVTARVAHVFARADGSKRLKVCNDNSKNLLSVPPSFSSLPLFLFPHPFCHFCETTNILLWALQPELKASQREWTLHFAKDLSLVCLKIKKKKINLKNQNFFLL